MLPEHIWKDYDNEQAIEFENAELIGSGPFKLLEYRQNEIVHLGKFADYYGEKPKVEFDSNKNTKSKDDEKDEK